VLRVADKRRRCRPVTQSVSLLCAGWAHLDTSHTDRGVLAQRNGDQKGVCAGESSWAAVPSVQSATGCLARRNSEVVPSLLRLAPQRARCACRALACGVCRAALNRPTDEPPSHPHASCATRRGANGSHQASIALLPRCPACRGNQRFQPCNVSCHRSAPSQLPSLLRVQRRARGGRGGQVVYLAQQLLLLSQLLGRVWR